MYLSRYTNKLVSVSTYLKLGREAAFSSVDFHLYTRLFPFIYFRTARKHGVSNDVKYVGSTP